MRKLYIILLFLFAHTGFADQNVLNVYNWTDYIPSSVIEQFEKQTGITVNYNEFTSNDEMYAKLRANPNIGYDVVVPSSYFVTRMAKQHMLHNLDLKKLSNLKYIDKRFLNKSYDPHNKYSVPFFWGSTIIAVNKNYINPESITSWHDLWQPEFKRKILLMNDLRDAFSAPLIMNKQSINSRNPIVIKNAYQRLKSLWPNIKLINNNNVSSVLADEDAIVGIAWNADIFSASQDNPNITGVYPKEGFAIWVDNMVILKNAPHVANAYKFINFIMQPKITAEIAENVNYSTVNPAARKLLPKVMRDSPILYPSKKVLARSQFESYVGNADRLYKNYWEKFRAG